MADDKRPDETLDEAREVEATTGKSTESTENDRRRVLKSTLAGGAVVTASILPDGWSRPAVGSVILPAHAATTEGGGSEGQGSTTPTPLTGPYFSEISLPNGVQGTSRTQPANPMLDGSSVAKHLLDAVIPSAEAAPMPAMLCIEMTVSGEVKITLAEYRIFELPSPCDQARSINTQEGYILWSGKGPLGQSINLASEGCKLKLKWSCTASNPTPTQVSYSLNGSGGTLPSRDCKLPEGFCPNLSAPPPSNITCLPV